MASRQGPRWFRPCSTIPASLQSSRSVSPSPASSPRPTTRWAPSSSTSTDFRIGACPGSSGRAGCRRGCPVRTSLRARRLRLVEGDPGLGEAQDDGADGFLTMYLGNQRWAALWLRPMLKHVNGRFAFKVERRRRARVFRRVLAAGLPRPHIGSALHGIEVSRRSTPSRPAHLRSSTTGRPRSSRSASSHIRRRFAARGGIGPRRGRRRAAPDANRPATPWGR